MNPNIRLALIIVVFVLMGAGIYFLFGQGESASPAAPPRAESTTPDEPLLPTETSFEPNAATATPQASVQQSIPAGSAGLRSGTLRTQGVKGFERTGRGVVSGMVVDNNGAPVPSASVTLISSDSLREAKLPSKARRLESETGEEGRFEFGSLANGSYLITATKGSAVACTSASLNDYQSVHDQVIQLRDGGPVSGKVVSGSGTPIAGAVVRPLEHDGELKERTWAEQSALRVEADDEGAFEIAALPEGRWRFLVTADGHASLESDFISVGSRDVEFVLEGGGVLTGRVLDSTTGQPVPDVTVRAAYTEEGADFHDIDTDALGVYLFPALRAGEYRIALDDEKLVLTIEAPEVLVTDNQETVQDLEVATGGLLTGRVYDEETGRGVSGAIVTSYHDERNGGPARKSEPSDGDGRFKLEGLANGRHRLYVDDAPGYPARGGERSQYVTAAIGETISGVDFAVDRGATIQGRVLDAGGAPVSGAIVSGRSDQYSSRDVERSGAGGRFELDGFSYASKAYLWAEHEDKVSEVAGPLNIAELGPEGVELRLTVSRDGRIEGKVVGAEPENLAGAQIHVIHDGYHQVGQGLRAVANKSGEFFIDRIPPGTLRFSVLAAGTHRYRQVPETVTLEEGEQRSGVVLTLNEAEGLVISGRVMDEDGEPLAGAYVNVYGNNASDYVRTGEDGIYEARGLQEGEYYVQANHQEHTQEQMTGIAAGSRNVDFRLRKNGALEGRVVNARNNDSLVDFQVYAVEGTRDNLESWMNQQFMRVHDPEGRFRITRVSAGEVTLFARAEGFVPTSVVIPNVPSGDTYEGLTVALEPSMIIEGVVTNDAGAPVVGAMIYLGEIPQAWERDRSSAAETGPDGRFRLTSVPNEANLVSAYHPSYSPGAAPIIGEQVEIVLGRGGAVQGRIFDGNKPFPNAQVNLRSQGEGGSDESTRANGEGYYEFTNVAVGAVTVTSYRQEGDGWRSVDRDGVVAANQVTEIDVVFHPLDSSLTGRVFLGGSAVTGGSVSITVNTGTSEERYSTELAADGSYTFDAIPAGQATLAVRGQRDGTSGRTQFTVNIPARTGLQQDVQLAETARITGTLTGGQRAMRGVSAFYGEMQLPTTYTPETLAELDPHRAAQDTVGADGRYSFSGLEPGTYTLVAWSLDGTDAASLANIQLSQSEVVVLEEGEAVSLDFQLP